MRNCSPPRPSQPVQLSLSARSMTVALMLPLAFAACGQGTDTGVRAADQAAFEWAALTMAPYTRLVDLDAAPSPQAAIDAVLADPGRGQRASEPDLFVRGGTARSRAQVATALADAGWPGVYRID